jgi:hypothetical protein
VEVAADEVRFSVNDVEVATLAAEGLDTEGIFGLRVNHNVNIHVTNLDVARKEM